MNDCLFCKIIRGEIPSDKVYEDEWVYAFNDINPIAPIHVLVIPKTHFDSANSLADDSSTASRIFSAIAKIADKLGIAEKGYRVITNCGEDGGQTVKHLHFHLVGGEKLDWPQ